MNQPQIDLVEAQNELAALLVSTSEVEEALQHVASITVKAVPADYAGVTLQRDRHLVTASSSDRVVTLVEEVQYREGSGPCLEAMQDDALVYTPDLSEEERWGEFPAVANGYGIESMCCVPLRRDGSVVGALNAYSRRKDGFAIGQQMLRLLADHASLLLSSVIRHVDQIALTAQMAGALSSRAIIDQAIGILMAQTRKPAAEAFELLRAISNRRNVKLRDVAEQIIAKVTGMPGR